MDGHRPLRSFPRRSMRSVAPATCDLGGKPLQGSSSARPTSAWFRVRSALVLIAVVACDELGRLQRLGGVRMKLLAAGMRLTYPCASRSRNTRATACPPTCGCGPRPVLGLPFRCALQSSPAVTGVGPCTALPVLTPLFGAFAMFVSKRWTALSPKKSLASAPRLGCVLQSLGVS